MERGLPAGRRPTADHSGVRQAGSRPAPGIGLRHRLPEHQGRVQRRWLTGEFIDDDKGKDTDQWALNKGYISIVPVQYDFTAHHAITNLKHLEE